MWRVQLTSTGRLVLVLQWYKPTKYWIKSTQLKSSTMHSIFHTKHTLRQFQLGCCWNIPALYNNSSGPMFYNCANLARDFCFQSVLMAWTQTLQRTHTHTQQFGQELYFAHNTTATTYWSIKYSRLVWTTADCLRASYDSQWAEFYCTVMLQIHNNQPYVRCLLTCHFLQPTQPSILSGMGNE